MNTCMILIIFLPMTFSSSSKKESPVVFSPEEKESPVTVEKSSNLEREEENNDVERRQEIEIIDKASGNFENVYGRGTDGGVAIPREYPSDRESAAKGHRNIVAEREGLGGFYGGGGGGQRGFSDRKDIFYSGRDSLGFGRGNIGGYGGFNDQDGFKGFKGFGVLCKRGRRRRPKIHDYDGDFGGGLRGGFNIGSQGKLNIGGYGGFNAGNGGNFDLEGYGGLDLGGYELRGGFKV